MTPFVVISRNKPLADGTLGEPINITHDLMKTINGTCVYVCMYVCMYVCTYICTYMYVYMYMCVCIYAYVLYVCTCMYVACTICVNTVFTHISIFVYVYT